MRHGSCITVHAHVCRLSCACSGLDPASHHLHMPRVAASADDCEVGSSGRKACKNCTCGRAEAEASDGVKLTPEMLENAPESACGSVS